MCYDVMNIPYLSHNTSLVLVQVLVPAFTSLSAITYCGAGAGLSRFTFCTIIRPHSVISNQLCRAGSTSSTPTQESDPANYCQVRCEMGREAQCWPLHFPRVKTGIVERESRKIAKCKKDEDIVFVSNMKFAMHCILFALINGELHGKSWHKMFANSVETVCERLWKQQTIKVTVMVLVLAAARTSYIRWAGLGCWEMLKVTLVLCPPAQPSPAQWLVVGWTGTWAWIR